jgi:hypothetical protein
MRSQLFNTVKFLRSKLSGALGSSMKRCRLQSVTTTDNTLIACAVPTDSAAVNDRGYRSHV